MYIGMILLSVYKRSNLGVRTQYRSANHILYSPLQVPVCKFTVQRMQGMRHWGPETNLIYVTNKTKD